MASIIPGFEYDIFISYRQKDNKYDGWVSEFVNNLNRELEATFKEEISVYFDVSPHDGLLETHDVTASLKEKLKCLVFIPVISQTYCDPNSFAWQFELCPFNKQAKEDQFGRDIRLAGGNVASRILPVKIHDIDLEDKTLLENELGGMLRPIEFIYKESGVNRPLKPTDDKNDNQNKTDYRNQVNKIANAIKEIIGGIKLVPKMDGSAITDPANIPQKSSEIFDSIAVLPFANMSSDPEQEYFSDGISEEIINVLAQLPNLKVAGRTSSFTFKDKNEDLRIIGEKLGVKTILEGSVRSSGNRIRITAQLINVRNGFHLWSEKYDREMKDIFDIQDEISLAIVEELKIKLFEKDRIQILKSKTQNIEAFNYYLKGRFFWHNTRTKEGIEKAIKYFEQAVEADPNYALAYVGLADAHLILADWGYLFTKTAVPKVKDFLARSFELDDALADYHSSLMYVSLLEWNWSKAEAESKKAIELNQKSATFHHFYAIFQMISGNFKVAIEHNSRARELDPLSVIFNFAGGLILYMAHRFDDAINQFRKALEIDNSFSPAYFWTSFCYIHKGMYPEAVGEYQNLLSRGSNTASLVSVPAEIFKQSGKDGFLNWLIEIGIPLDIGIYNQPYHVASCYALLNNVEMAFECLEKTCEQSPFRMAMFNSDPSFDTLHGDPKFLMFLKRVGLQ